MTEHHCKHPVCHRLLGIAAVLFWVTVIALWALPTAVYGMTHSAAWAFLSIGLALTVGRVCVRWLAYGHCQPCPQPWGLHLLRRLTLTAWALRGDR
jgi:hypothetical protein